MLWDGSTRRQIAHFGNNARDPGDLRDFQWQINQKGQLAWRGWNGRDREIYRWDGSNTAQLSEDDQDAEALPIKDSRQGVGESEGQVYLWDGSTVQTLTPPGTRSSDPKRAASNASARRGRSLRPPLNARRSASTGGRAAPRRSIPGG